MALEVHEALDMEVHKALGMDVVERLLLSSILEPGLPCLLFSQSCRFPLADLAVGTQLPPVLLAVSPHILLLKPLD